MSGRVWKTSAATDDLIECATYLGERSPSATDRFLDAVAEGLDLLVRMPQLGAVYEPRNPRLEGIRIWRVKGFEKYLVFYRPAIEGIEVIRVLHAVRDWAAILGDA